MGLKASKNSNVHDRTLIEYDNFNARGTTSVDNIGLRGREPSYVIEDVFNQSRKRTVDDVFILPTVEEESIKVKLEGAAEVEVKANEDDIKKIFDAIEPYVPRMSKTRHFIRKIVINRSNLEHLKMENSYLFYNKLVEGHVMVFRVIMKLIVTGYNINEIIKMINKVLISLTYSVIIKDDRVLSLYFDIQHKLNLIEKLQLLDTIVSKEENDVELVESFKNEPKKFDWFISHNGSIKQQCIEWFGQGNCFIDKLSYDSETSNKRWLMLHMKQSKGVVFMMNKEFTNSKWCKWELDMAKLIQSSDKAFKIFPIILEGDFQDYPSVKLYPGKSMKNTPISEIIDGLFGRLESKVLTTAQNPNMFNTESKNNQPPEVDVFEAIKQKIPTDVKSQVIIRNGIKISIEKI